MEVGYMIWSQALQVHPLLQPTLYTYQGSYHITPFHPYHIPSWGMHWNDLAALLWVLIWTCFNSSHSHWSHETDLLQPMGYVRFCITGMLPSRWELLGKPHCNKASSVLVACQVLGLCCLQSQLKGPSSCWPILGVDLISFLNCMHLPQPNLLYT